MSCTKALLSKLEQLDFEGRLARKLCFQSFNTWNLKEVSHEMRMHELVYFAGQNVSRMMCGEACPADGFGTRSLRGGSFLNRPRSGLASSGIVIVLRTCLRVV